MDIEWEAKFTNIDKNKLREKLKSVGAKLVKPEFLQKRVTFNLPPGHEVKGAWVRVRDEGDKITLSLKIVDGASIKDQREITVVVDDFEKTRTFLSATGFQEKSYQENKRELWVYKGVEITLDEWPFLEPFVELEAGSEKEVREVSKLLGYNWKDAVFGSTHLLTSKKYNIPEDVLNNKIPRIVFGEDNPYLKWLEDNKNER